MKANRTLYISLVFLILVLSCIFRLYGLDRLSLWSDELWVVMESTRGSVWQMLGWVYHNDNHPPGYYLLLRYTQFIFGSSDYAIRFPSAIAGIALVGATFVAGRKHFSLPAAVIASALVAGSYQAIYYSQEARPNIFMALFALLAFHYFRAVILEGDDSRKNYLLFWVSAALSCYFHYSGLVFCACLGVVYLIVALTERNKKTTAAGIKLFLPLAIFYLPWISGTLHDLVNSPPELWQRTPDTNTLKTTVWFLFGPDDVQVFFYLAVLLITVVILFIKKDNYSLILYTLAMIFLPVALFFIKSVFSQDAYNHRHFLYAIPLMALLAGYLIHEVINWCPQRYQTAVVVAVTLFIIGYQFFENVSGGLYTANHFKEEYREGAQVVANDNEFLQGSNHAIISNSYFFDHYLNRFTANKHQSDFIYDRPGKFAELQLFLETHHTAVFYYLETPLIPAANKMITDEDRSLSESYRPLCRTRFGRVQVFKFSIDNNAVKENLSNLPDCRPGSP